MSRQPRVWMLISGFYPLVGGAERQCLKLSKALREKGFDTHVVTQRLCSELPRYDFVESVPVTRLPVWRPVELNLVQWLIYLAAHRHKYDILHMHVVGFHVAAGILCKWWWGKKVVIKIANSGERFDLRLANRNHRWTLRYLIQKGVHSADAVIGISRTIQAELLERNIDASKIISIPNGVELVSSNNSVLRRKRRRELGLPEDICIVLRVGSFLPKKGISTLLSAWSEIVDRYPQALLLSVGGTELPVDLKRQIQVLGDRVKIVFSQPNGVLQYLQAADILVLPSLAEGLSNALLEAQACGLPCVATRVGGNGDIIEDGHNGLLVEPNNVSELVVALESLMSSDELRIRMGKRSTELIVKFDINNIAKQYEKLYRELISRD